MGARFALAQPWGVNAPRAIRRFAGPVETMAAVLGAAIAGLFLLAPLNLGGSEGSVLELDLMVLNMPRAAAAGAAFAVVSAALVVALGRRSAWIASFGSAVVLLVNHLWNSAPAGTGVMTTVNYIDAIFSGILLGALAVAVFGKPVATGAYLIGALSGILIGDQTSLPESGEGNPLIEWASGATPPLWLMLISAVLLALGIAAQHTDPAVQDENTDLAIGPILSALVLVTATALSTEWFVRHEGTPAQIAVAVSITVGAAAVAALLLPGREGTLVLLAVAVANAGSAIIAVPRPDWTAPFPVLAVILGLAAGRRWRAPWIGLAATGGLAVFAAATAGSPHLHAVIPVLGVTLTGLIIGYCFGAAVPATAGSAVVAVAVLIVPCLVVALRGSSFGRIAYSPRWYRDPQAALSSTPGWMALVITLGCAAGLYVLWRLRSPRVVATPEAPAVPRVVPVRDFGRNVLSQG
ncbi:hypothetical protein [Nocardia seriolae]|uniref:Uncharacterized protein n=1 Tax=Nocardia seriolae TaxID=37332 RepID=A0A0B8NA01_9NOCA|nr:hypothetical protein [Nocardia seriolae]APB01242.1 hypothetical protein NS506_07221 [Nocardia seriolae]MTJ61255.1 hypothetical protein [Nocardia seriolae]MTJ70012.1 hypothetical protein [Nocardia seriolae]MTJ90620.1 hypothetical protein [Nocardia seriolae]MTK34581.1 hypothetical protein [Nocardia seriolae]